MRTTLTLDDDVAALLRQVQEKRKGRLKDVINEALRQGLIQMATPPACRPQYPGTPSASLGRCLLGSIDDTAETLAAAEGEAFR